jgi:hypothetical protein
MKALSLRQPWAHAVLYLGKRLENRKWNVAFRGEFLIHASGTVGNRGEFSDACEIISDVVDELAWVDFRDRFLGITTDLSNNALFIPSKEMELGGIVGRARIVDVIAPCLARTAISPVKKPRSFRDAFARRCRHTWHAPEQHAFVLDDVKRTPFVPCKGALSFFEVPEDILGKANGT